MTRVQPQAPPVATEASNGDPTTEGKKRGRQALPKHPSVEGDNKIDEVPADFDRKQHAPLKEENFSDGCVHKFWLYQADSLEARAKILRNKAGRYEKTGSFSDKKTAAKICDLQAQLEAAVAALAEKEGADKVQALMAKEG